MKTGLNRGIIQVWVHNSLTERIMFDAKFHPILVPY